MTPLVQSPYSRKSWKRLSILFLSLLPALAIFHLVMWFAFTRTLFRAETGSSKRIGYLVGLEDCYGKLRAQEPTSDYPVQTLNQNDPKTWTRVVYFNDSFAGQKACGMKWHEAVGTLRVNWTNKDGLSQIETWVKSGWFPAHGVKVIVVERVEVEWLNTFADKGDSTLDVPMDAALQNEIPSVYKKAVPWTFANNGNFKVIIDNFAYLFSPTAWNMTDTCLVHLSQKFFNCSYGQTLVFYRGDTTRGIANKALPRFEQAIANLKELSDLCHQEGMQFYLVVPPNKSTIYYPWITKPFFPRSQTLDLLEQRAKPYGYVDLQKPFHDVLQGGMQDLYYPDDLHWNFPAEQINADELTKAGAGPTTLQ
jgi:hypothetical protein